LARKGQQAVAMGKKMLAPEAGQHLSGCILQTQQFQPGKF
jgi:hypothetical protein